MCPFTVFRHPTELDTGCGQVNSSQAVLRCEFPPHRPRSGHDHHRGKSVQQQGVDDTVRSSLSSEEAPSDEGVEEAPSQSEGESGEGFQDKYSSFDPLEEPLGAAVAGAAGANQGASEQYTPQVRDYSAAARGD